MKRLFISDLHLQDPDSEIFRAFVDLMRAEAPLVNEIYILGDLVEMWVGDDDDSPCAQALGQTLNRASQHAQIFIVHGNRDFLFGDAFASASGATILPDPYLLDGHILLSHGDQYCIDDEAYQQARVMLRSESFQRDLLQRSLAERQALGKQMRAQSVEANANKSDQIMDVNLGAISQAMHDHDADILIHGHTHRPGVYPRRGASTFKRIVLGDWQDCGWLCRQDGDQWSLECFGLTHYAI
ncbi:MAG: UDP-2,3-diacylglucosamine diphosphatase [Gammaproteobacteria bacterium]